MVNSKKAQGTIEYLVIIATVVVLSLIIVGLVFTSASSPSQEIKNSSSKLSSSSSSGISVVESVLDLQGDSIVKIGNNSSDSITLTRVSVGGVVNDFDEQLVGLDSKVFSLSDLVSGCKCLGGQASVDCDYVITYLQNGIEKNYRVTKSIDCVVDSVPVNPGVVVGLGVGTLADPWVINSCRELQDMNLHLDGNYKLGADIDCSDTINWNNGFGFNPIGTSAKKFSGNFNGNSKTISDLFIRRISTNYTGLFGYSIGSISNVGLVDVNITGKDSIGALVGMQVGGSISNSYSKGDINAYNALYAGGLAGIAYLSSVSNSYSLVNMVGYRYTGGLIGGVSNTTVSNSYSISIVRGSSYFVGGLVGHQIGGSISNSYSISAVTSLLNNNAMAVADGLVGYQESGNIFNSYSVGTVSGENDYIGGLVGYQESAAGLFNSYSITNVIGSNNANYVGGLVGYSSGDISNCYSAGSVTSSTNIIGGLVGSKDTKLISNSYWDITRTGISNCCGGGTCANCFGKNSLGSESDAFFPKSSLAGDYNVPMQHNLIDANWTFGIDGNWTKRDNNYPILSWQ